MAMISFDLSEAIFEGFYLRFGGDPADFLRRLPQLHGEIHVGAVDAHCLTTKKVVNFSGVAMIGVRKREACLKATGKFIDELSREITRCRKCPRLVRYREAVAREKRAAFQDWNYWGKPVPGFGDPTPQLVILGLAPAAHGANRTGRMFTGDRSGDFLYQALYRTGFANQATSTRRSDGLELCNAYIAAAVRCAPPDNKPLPEELANCRPYLERELDLRRPQAILALGSIAMRTYLGYLRDRGAIKSLAAFPFRHGASYQIGEHLPHLFTSYHPSQQNTFTGKLTEQMLESVLNEIRAFLAGRGLRSR